MADYPAAIVPAGHVEPVPRRIRALLAGETIVDTTRARYVWEWPNYPQYYIPMADIRPGRLVPEGGVEVGPLGDFEVHSLHAGDAERPHAAKVLRQSPVEGLSGSVRFDWSAFDAWFEEDEQVFVHPRNPYARVDALRSIRAVRVELEGALIAESSSPVMVFETGLPTRYYLNRTDLDFAYLLPTATVTACPYKGRTSAYWSIRVGDRVHPDLAWSYDFPTRELLPIAGLVAFYNERVDLFVDDLPLERPQTPFFMAAD